MTSKNHKKGFTQHHFGNFSQSGAGFTLVELLVVIAVIGLLASIVLVSMGSAREKARDARRQADIRQIGTAMELYYSDNSEKYLSATGGANTVTAIPNPCSATLCYLPDVPNDPQDTAATRQYTWVANSADLQKYCVYVKLEAPTASTYVCSSQRGTLGKVSATAPTLDACCY
ncbi:MAG: type II secretion system protein [bacterium]|nr:type II secretion system protein [bacterium]